MLYVGIDGGGTRTTYVLCRRDGSIAAGAQGPGTNLNQVGFDVFAARVSSGVDVLLRRAGGETVTLFGGFAGGAAADHRAKISAFFHQRFPSVQASCGSDAMNALHLGLGTEDGIAVIAGTGSSLHVRRNKSIQRIGGWGYLLDPAGSGYAIGRDALYLKLMTEDGRARPSILTMHVTNTLGRPVSEALSDIYAGGCEKIASFAPLVFQAADKGCPRAKEILEKTAQYIAGLVRAGMAGFSGPVKIALVGGLFRRADLLLPLLQPEIGAQGQLFVPDLPPVYGAVLCAASRTGLTITRDFPDKFRAGLCRMEEVGWPTC